MGLFLICAMLTAFESMGQDAGEDRTTDGDVTELLGKGILAEETDNPAKALSYYQQALNAFEQYRESAAAAVFRMAETYRKLGDERAAREHYRRIVSEFSDFDEFARKSREYLRATRSKAEP